MVNLNNVRFPIYSPKLVCKLFGFVFITLVHLRSLSFILHVYTIYITFKLNHLFLLNFNTTTIFFLGNCFRKKFIGNIQRYDYNDNK